MKFEIEIRLRNWGRWSRNKNSGIHTSPIYRLMVEYGEAPVVGVGGVQTTDERDALVVDAAMLKAGLKTYERELLKLVYIGRYGKSYVCRTEGIRFRDYERVLKRAVDKVAQVLEVSEEDFPRG